MHYTRTLFAACCLLFAPCMAEQEKTHDIMLEIKIHCEEGEEFVQFFESIPQAGNYSTSFEEWKSSFVGSMNRLIELVESGKVYSSGWTANVTDHEQDELQPLE